MVERELGLSVGRDDGAVVGRDEGCVISRDNGEVVGMPLGAVVGTVGAWTGRTGHGTAQAWVSVKCRDGATGAITNTTTIILLLLGRL